MALLSGTASLARAQGALPTQLARELITRGVPPEAMDDARAVLSARYVGGFHYGFAGLPLGEITGLRNLLRSLPAAARVPVLRLLAARATPAGRVYALAALEGVARPVFEQLSARYIRSTARVEIANDGCMQWDDWAELGVLVDARRAHRTGVPFDVASGRLWELLLACDDPESVLCSSGGFGPQPISRHPPPSPPEAVRNYAAPEQDPYSQLGPDVIDIVTAPGRVEVAWLRAPTERSPGRRIAGLAVRERPRTLADDDARAAATMLVNAHSYSAVSADGCAAERASWLGLRFARGDDVVELATGLDCNSVAWVAIVDGRRIVWNTTFEPDAGRVLERIGHVGERSAR